MAQITFTIPNDKIASVADAFAAIYSWPASVTNPAFNPALPEEPTSNPRLIPNPESKQGHLRRKVLEYVQQVTVSFRVNKKAAEETEKERVLAVADMTGIS